MQKVLIFSLLFLSGCAYFSLKAPEVKMQEVEIKKFTEKAIDLDVTLEIKNPNTRELEIDTVKYGFQLNDSAFFRKEIDGDYKIAAKGTKIIALPISVPTDALVGAVFDMLVNKPMSYNIVGSLKVNGMNVTFNKTGNMPKRDPL
jgi:LEA14-like dessication related protein